MAGMLDRVQPQPPQPQQPQTDEPSPEEASWVVDAIKTFGPRVVKSTAGMIGGIGDLNNNAGWVASKALQLAGMDPEKADKWGIRLGTAMFPGAALAPSTEDMQRFVPEQHEPQTPAGEIAGRVADELPYMAAAPGAGTILNRTLSTLGSAGGGYLGHEVGKRVADFGEKQFGMDPSWRPYIEGAFDIGGSIGGSFAPQVMQHAVTPNPMDDERRRLADTLDRRGVPMSAGQRTGNEDLHFKESQTGGRTYRDLASRQKQEYTRGALDIGGIHGPRAATPEAFNQQHQRLGREFERLQQYGMQPDQQLFSDLVQVRDGYTAEVPESMRIGIIQNTIDDLVDRSTRGVPVDGEYVKIMGSKLRRARERLRANNQALDAEYVDGLIDVIDDAVERSLPAQEQGRYREVRTLYRNLITLEEAASSSTNGQLTPADLTRATKKMETRRGYSRGFGPFNEYSRAGEELIYHQPQSGTGPRLLSKVPALERFGNLPAIIGGGIGYAAGGGSYTGALVGATGGGMVNDAVQRIRMHPWMQEYLANQLAADWAPGVGAGMRATVGGVAAAKEKY